MSNSPEQVTRYTLAEYVFVSFSKTQTFTVITDRYLNNCTDNVAGKTKSRIEICLGDMFNIYNSSSGLI